MIRLWSETDRVVTKIKHDIHSTANDTTKLSND
jgi:hypothetical protein